MKFRKNLSVLMVTAVTAMLVSAFTTAEGHHNTVEVSTEPTKTEDEKNERLRQKKEAIQRGAEQGRGYEDDGITPVGKKVNPNHEKSGVFEEATWQLAMNFKEIFDKANIGDLKYKDATVVVLNKDGTTATRGIDFDVVNKDIREVISDIPFEEAFKKGEKYGLRPNRGGLTYYVTEAVDFSEKATKELIETRKAVEKGAEVGRGLEKDGITII